MGGVRERYSQRHAAQPSNELIMYPLILLNQPTNQSEPEIMGIYILIAVLGALWIMFNA